VLYRTRQVLVDLGFIHYSYNKKSLAREAECTAPFPPHPSFHRHFTKGRRHTGPSLGYGERTFTSPLWRTEGPTQFVLGFDCIEV
jgi:hypothetical protein